VNESILSGVTLRKIPYILSILIVGVLAGGCSILNSAASDQAALDSLLDAGSDFTEVHPFDFYLYHPDQSGAEQICAQLRAQDFEVAVKEGAIEGEWLCLASLSFIPSMEKLSELQDEFEALISQYGGEYDGWETIVIPR
jgi:regulator of RNase E activity RraB